jgi:hypothetical protein
LWRLFLFIALDCAGNIRLEVSVMISKFSHSGAVVCWDSMRCGRDLATAAFDAVGGRKFIPPVNHLAALTDAAKRVAADHGLMDKDHPPLKFFTLDRSTKGIGVHYEIRSREANEYPHLFSIAVGDDESSNPGHVEVVKVSASCPAGVFFAGSLADSTYQQAIGYMTASDVTRGVNALVKARHGLLLRQNGSVFFLPGDFIAEYETLADGLAKGGPQLHCWTVDLTANPALLDTIHNKLQDELLCRLEKRQQEWDELQARKGSPQERGLQSRFDEMLDDAQHLEFYEQFLSVRHDKIRTLLEQQQTMIGMAHMSLWEQPA